MEILNSHQLQLKSAQNDLQIKKKKNDSHKKETSESSNKVHQAVKVEEEVLSNIQLISDRLEYIAADIALLSLQNQTTKNLLSKIENLYNICNEIKQGIWLVVTPWQGSNVRAAGELADAVKGIGRAITEKDGTFTGTCLICISHRRMPFKSDDVHRTAVAHRPHFPSLL